MCPVNKFFYAYKKIAPKSQCLAIAQWLYLDMCLKKVNNINCFALVSLLNINITRPQWSKINIFFGGLSFLYQFSPSLLGNSICLEFLRISFNSDYNIQLYPRWIICFILITIRSEEYLFYAFVAVNKKKCILGIMLN